ANSWSIWLGVVMPTADRERAGRSVLRAWCERLRGAIVSWKDRSKVTNTVSGAFEPGDRVQLTDPKGRHYTIVLRTGGEYHTHRGVVAHDKLIGEPEGSVVTSVGGTSFLALRP